MKTAFFLVKRVTFLGLLALASACTMNGQDPPELTGPSEQGLSVNVAVTPDIIQQDGASQSTITITARDANGDPVRNVPLRVEILVNGTAADFGSLSARNVVTDNNGRATVVYTAPAAVAGQAGVDTFTLVDFVVTPLGDNFNNSLPRIASIRLVPSGVIIPPSGLVAAFTVTPTTPSEGQTVLFQSTSTAPANNPIVRAQWDFGDGDRAEGSSVQHEYDLAGTYVATLTVFDALGRSATTSRSINVTVNAATEPTADFDFSPRNPTVGTQVNFNGQLSTPGQGQRIISYEWDFGDGTTGTGERVAHTYTRLATYSVVLRVTNSQGKTSTISKTVQVQ